MTWFEKLAASREPDLDIKVFGESYLQRWWFFPRNRFFNIYLHKISRSDESTFHDHPWRSLSFVLKGSMIEKFPGSGRLCEEGKWYYRTASTLHRLELLKGKPEPVWTLFFTGSVVREWGFQTDDGWEPHFQYFREGIDALKDY